MLKSISAKLLVAVPMFVITADAAFARCTLYEHMNYQGSTFIINGNAQVAFFGGRFNDKVSSVKVEPGCRFIGFQHRDYAGWSREFTQSTNYFPGGLNDAISSGRCLCQPVVAPAATPEALLKNVLEAVLRANRGAFEAQLNQRLNGLQLAKGYNLREMKTAIGSIDFQLTSPTSFRAALKGNTVRGKSTQPTVFGSYADPGVSVNFDVILNGRLQPPKPGQKLRIESLIAHVPSATFRGTNLTGTVLTAGVAIFKATGPGGKIIQDAANRYLVQDLTKRANAELAKR